MENRWVRYAVDEMKEDIETALAPERLNESKFTIPSDEDVTKAIPIITNDQLFEDYDCQDVLILEEFESSLPFNTLLHYIQDYPTKLPARYSNKVACYTKVYIMSELSIQRQYPSHQYDDNKCFKEFIDKIKSVVICEEGKELTIFPNADKGEEHTQAP